MDLYSTLLPQLQSQEPTTGTYLTEIHRPQTQIMEDAQSISNLCGFHVPLITSIPNATHFQISIKPNSHKRKKKT
jgi:hypothetical protein